MNQSQALEQFMADRDTALLSLDKEKIISFCRRWGVRFPNSNNEKVFWAEVHKARICLSYFPEDERELSRSWLQNNGFGVPETVGKERTDEKF